MSWLGLLVGEFRVCIWVAVFGVLPVCTLGSACDTLLASMLLVSRECRMYSVHTIPGSTLHTLRKHDNQGQLLGLRPGVHAADGCTAWN